MQIYLARNNIQAGPYSLDELNRMLAGGQVHLSDLAWHEGLSQWQPLGQLTGGKSVYQPGGPTPLASATPAAAGSSPRLSLDKPADQFNPPVGALPAVTEYHISSLYKRIAASVLDMCLFLLSMLPILRQMPFDTMQSERMTDIMAAMENIPQQDMLVATLLMAGLLLVQCTLTVKRGQTLGKLVLGTRIVDQHSGQVPSVTQVLLVRTVAFNLLYNLPLIGPLVLVADAIAMMLSPQRQSLHDRAARTFVVDTKAPSSTAP